MVLRGASRETIGIIINRQARGPADVRHTQNNQAPISIDPDRCTQDKLRSKSTRACFVGGGGGEKVGWWYGILKYQLLFSFSLEENYNYPS